MTTNFPNVYNIHVWFSQDAGNYEYDSDLRCRVTVRSTVSHGMRKPRYAYQFFTRSDSDCGLHQHDRPIQARQFKAAAQELSRTRQNYLGQGNQYTFLLFPRLKCTASCPSGIPPHIICRDAYGSSILWETTTRFVSSKNSFEMLLKNLSCLWAHKKNGR